MKILLSSLFVIIAGASTVAAQFARVTPGDLKTIEGQIWTGTLTYLDYSSNRRTSLRCELKVTRVAKRAAAWRFEYMYPDEPKANRSSNAELSSDGRKFFGEDVIERSKLAGGVLKLVTTQRGTDDDKPALFRYTYLIGRRSLSIIKEVRLDDTDKYFERNTYSWTR